MIPEKGGTAPAFSDFEPLTSALFFGRKGKGGEAMHKFKKWQFGKRWKICF